MVDGERQIGSLSGDATRDIFEASFSAVHLHHTPVVTDITWQSFGVRNASRQYGETTPEAQQCHTHLYRNTKWSTEKCVGGKLILCLHLVKKKKKDNAHIKQNHMVHITNILSKVYTGYATS